MKFMQKTVTKLQASIFFLCRQPHGVECHVRLWL